MASFKNIIICLDLTEMDEVLIKYANFLTSTFESKKLTFIHVMETIDIPDELAEAFPDMDKPLNEIIREEIEEQVHGLFEHADKVEIDIILDSGIPTEQIIQHARKRRVDLALLGKKTGYAGEGGVAKRIVGLMPATVLMVSETSPHHINNILVRMDFSKMSAMALKTAQTIAGHTQAKVECHHVYKLPLDFMPQQSPSALQKLKKQMGGFVSKQFAGFLKKNKMEADAVCTYSIDHHGDEAQILYGYAIKTGADLVLAGSKIKSPLANVMLDSTSEKLASPNKSIPVMVVKDQKQSIGFLKALFDF